MTNFISNTSDGCWRYRLERVLAPKEVWYSNQDIIKSVYEPMTMERFIYSPLDDTRLYPCDFEYSYHLDFSCWHYTAPNNEYRLLIYNGAYWPFTK